MAEEFNWDGYLLSSDSNDILTAEVLSDGCSPSRDVAERSADLVRLSWEKALDDAELDGYIIFRRFRDDGEVFWEIARISADSNEYHDEDVQGKGKKAFYIVAGFREDENGIVMSPCSGSIRQVEPRVYQNPEGFVQISGRISTHGYNYYTSPVLTNNASSREDHIEAMISTALGYLGDPCKVRYGGKPGLGVDCSGLVMQAAYGAGIDLWPCNPYRHRSGPSKYIMESTYMAEFENIKTVPEDAIRKGDLIFYNNDKDFAIHVAICLGDGKMLHSDGENVHIADVMYTDDARIYCVKRLFV